LDDNGHPKWYKTLTTALRNSAMSHTVLYLYSLILHTSCNKKHIYCIY